MMAMVRTDGGSAGAMPGSSTRPLLSRRSLLEHAAALLGLAGIGALAACGGSATATGTASTGSVSASAAPTTTSGAATTASAATSSAATTASAATSSTAASSAAQTTTAAATTSSATGASSATSAHSAAVGGTKATLTFVAPSGRYDVDQAIFADFTKAHPDISVEVVAGTTSWTIVEEKVKTSIAGGTPINIYENGWGYWYATQAALMDFAPLMAQAKLDPDTIFVPVAVDYWKQNGKLWALPLIGISVDALAYNQDMFDAAGLAHPPSDLDNPNWTMEKFLDNAQKLTDATKLHFGFGGDVGGGDTGGIERPTYFGQQPWDDKAQKALMDQPKAVQGVQFFKDLRDKYQVQPSSAQVTSIGAPKGQDVFTSGKIGMQVIYGYIPKLNFNWAIVPLPHDNSVNVSGRQYAQALQATKTPLSDQTWTLMQWLMIPANAARLPLAAHYAVSPVAGASDLAVAAYKEQVGVDPTAFRLMTEHTGFEAAGMYKYPGWTTVQGWLSKNFPLFDQGKQTADDYGRAATNFINANLMKG
jgi:ABC-type glycerol-3-phosphate transport system substrate-binding protein